MCCICWCPFVLQRKTKYRQNRRASFIRFNEVEHNTLERKTNAKRAAQTSQQQHRHKNRENRRSSYVTEVEYNIEAYKDATKRANKFHAIRKTQARRARRASFIAWLDSDGHDDTDKCEAPAPEATTPKRVQTRVENRRASYVTEVEYTVLPKPKTAPPPQRGGIKYRSPAPRMARSLAVKKERDVRTSDRCSRFLAALHIKRNETLYRA